MGNAWRNEGESWPLVLVDSTAGIVLEDRNWEGRKMAPFKICDCDWSKDARAIGLKVNQWWGKGNVGAMGLTITIGSIPINSGNQLKRRRTNNTSASKLFLLQWTDLSRSDSPM